MYSWRDIFRLPSHMGLEHFLYGKVGKEKTVAQMTFFEKGLSRRKILLAALRPVFSLLRYIHHY